LQLEDVEIFKRKAPETLERLQPSREDWFLDARLAHDHEFVATGFEFGG